MSRARMFILKAADKTSTRWQIADAQFVQAIAEIESGKADAALGGHVYKQRIALPGQGKSGSTRFAIIFQSGNRSLVVEGFAKGDQANFSRNDVKLFRELAKRFLALSDLEIENLLETKAIREI